jgi:dihydroceramide fatty acyl 2-hydroxylase
MEKREKPSTCRMFDTPFIEFFSHIHPVSPFAFWLPALAAMLAWALSTGLSVVLALMVLVPLGALTWSLVEYLLHRYVFHFVGPKPWQRRFHFIFHGVHHDFPQDAKRLVMPLGVSIPIGLVFFLLADAAMPRPMACAYLAGMGLGYLAYDGIHYFTHHGKARSALGKFLKRYHLVHHHTGVEGKWGVTSPLWDFVFRTRGEPSS